MEDIDVLFVNPNAKKENYGVLASEFAGIEPPVWCGLKAAYARDKGFKVDILDAELEDFSPHETAERIDSKNPLLVDIVVMGANPSASSTPKMESVKDVVKELKTKNIKSKTETEKEILQSGVEVFGENDDWIVYKTTSPEALSKLSWGTKWCTSDISTAQEYLSDGPMYIIFKKVCKDCLSMIQKKAII